jgi:hypothetical protein
VKGPEWEGVGEAWDRMELHLVVLARYGRSEDSEYVFDIEGAEGRAEGGEEEAKAWGRGLGFGFGALVRRMLAVEGNGVVQRMAHVRRVDGRNSEGMRTVRGVRREVDDGLPPRQEGSSAKEMTRGQSGTSGEWEVGSGDWLVWVWVGWLMALWPARWLTRQMVWQSPSG